jgi:hypothetical protein
VVSTSGPGNGKARDVWPTKMLAVALRTCIF